MAPTTRSASPKSGSGKKKEAAHSPNLRIASKTATKSAESSKAAVSKRKYQEHSASDESSSLFEPGFRPAVDNQYQPSPAEMTFQRRDTLFSTSPGYETHAGKGDPSPRKSNFEMPPPWVGSSPTAKRKQSSSLRREIFGKLPSISAASPSARAAYLASPRNSVFGGELPLNSGISPGRVDSATEALYEPSPRRSDFGRMASVGASSPARPTSSGGLQSAGPRKSIFGGSVPSAVYSPRTPKSPRSPFASKHTQPAKITVSASTKQEADGVLARQQLVRESLFELRGIITNLNWKVQQFEALVDRAEKDVVWDTASVEEIDRGGPRSGKRLRFSFDPTDE